MRYPQCLLMTAAVLLTTSTLTGDEAHPTPASRAVDFDTQIMPILTRQGCNAGSCHGAAVGRGGFKLSLLGSNASADHNSIVDQFEGRRVNLANPESSLLLRKPSEQLGHEGGDALPETSPGFDLVHRWIRQGARRNADRKLSKLTITPPSRLLAEPGEHVTISVTADFGVHGSSDVTAWTLFQVGDPEAVTIDKDGRRVTVHQRGVHVIIARFLDQVVPLRLTVPMHQTPASRQHTPLVANEIDPFINAQLDRLNLPASAPADDWTLVRRVTLDLAGRLPTADESRRYVQDSSPDKFDRWIHRLLQTKAFADYWAFKWANQLGIDSKQLQPEGADAYQRWLADRFDSDAAADETARMMLTSLGDGYVEGAVNFLRSGSSPGELAERTSRIFMGVRLQCANCHDHPLDHWKQDDYHGLAAIFAKVKRGRHVSVSQRGEVTHPLTGQPAAPRIPGVRFLARRPGDDAAANEVDPRHELADWLTSKQNPYFSKALVNRIWQQLMGRGLVNPIDDLRATNPATHPALLEWLANDLRGEWIPREANDPLDLQQCGLSAFLDKSSEQRCRHAVLLARHCQTA